MKYKDVFKIWLYANVILAIGIAVFSFLTNGQNGVIWSALLVTGILFFFSLPSLIALCCFHAWYSNKAEENGNFAASYIAAIVSINILYFLSSIIFFDIDFELALLYLATTAAGIISFYIVYKQVKRRSSEAA